MVIMVNRFTIITIKEKLMECKDFSRKKNRRLGRFVSINSLSLLFGDQQSLDIKLQIGNVISSVVLFKRDDLDTIRFGIEV